MFMSKHVLSQMIVNSILNLLLREGGAPVGGGGRRIYNPIIYKEIGTNIISPTTSVCDQRLTKKSLVSPMRLTKKSVVS